MWFGWGKFWSSRIFSSANYNTQEITQKNLREEEPTTRQSVSVLLLGSDIGNVGREDEEFGRSDVMMVLTLNPETKHATLTSIPRDSMVEINGQFDKINHAFFYGGYGLAANVVQDLLHIPIDYVVTVDMGGFEKIINALGGVTITSDATFTQSSFEFVEGETYKMSGAQALAYSRNREDSDYGRQKRQRQVLEALYKEVGGRIFSTFELFGLYSSVKDTITSNISVEDAYNLYKHYKDAIKSVDMYQLKGEGVDVLGVYYEELDEDSLKETRERLQKEMDYKPSASIQKHHYHTQVEQITDFKPHVPYYDEYDNVYYYDKFGQIYYKDGDYYYRYDEYGYTFEIKDPKEAEKEFVR